MWITPKAYMATPSSKRKIAKNISTVSWSRQILEPSLLFVASISHRALVGALIGQVLSKKLAQKI